MKDHPIIFSAPMVRALLEGRKTQTRRVVKPCPRHNPLGEWEQSTVGGARSYLDKGMTIGAKERVCIWHTRTGETIASPYAIGDRLWVRETWQDVHPLQVADGRYSQAGRGGIPGPPPVHYRTIYRADGEYPSIYSLGGAEHPYRRIEPFRYNGMQAFEEHYGWTPSIHMPREASRITLEITDVRVQRVQDITGNDVEAEGCAFPDGKGVEHLLERWAPWRELWDSINARRGFGWDANPWVWALTFRRVDALPRAEVPNFIFCSGAENPLKLEARDRRFRVVETGKAHA